MVTIDIAVDSIDVAQQFALCRYCIAFEAECFWFLFTGRIAAKRQTAGIKFTHRPKIRFFAPQG